MKVDRVELRNAIAGRRQKVATWLAVGHRARWVGGVLLAALLAAGLLLPPLSLVDRLATPGYRRVTPGGGDLSVPAEGVPTGGAQLEVPRTAILRSTRVRLRARTQLPGGPGDLPPGAEQLGPAYTLDFRGPLFIAERVPDRPGIHKAVSL